MTLNIFINIVYQLTKCRMTRPRYEYGFGYGSVLGYGSGFEFGSSKGSGVVLVLGMGMGLSLCLGKVSMRANANGFHARYVACVSFVYASKFLLIPSVQFSPSITISKRF